MSAMVWNFSDMRSFNISRRQSDEFQVDVKTIVCRVDTIIFERVVHEVRNATMSRVTVLNQKNDLSMRGRTWEIGDMIYGKAIPI